MKRVLNDFRPFLGLFCASTGRKLLGGAALAALTGLMGMALLGLSGWFITATALAGLVPATAWAFDVFMPSAAIRLFALGRTAARYGERLVTHDATLGLLAALRGRLFRGWSAPGAARALAMRPARLLFRLTADVDALDTVYLRVLVPLGTTLVATLAAGIALAFISPALGVAVFAVLMLTGTFVAGITARSATPATLRRAARIETLRARVIDLASGQTDLLMAGRIPAQRAALAEVDARLAADDHRLNRIEARAGLAHGLLAAVLPALVLVAAAAIAAGGHIGAPGVALALLITMAATEPFAALRRGALDFARARLAARRTGPALLCAAFPVGAEPAPGLAAELHHVTLRHDAALAPILRDLSLSVREGEHIALIGPSGVGKTSVIQCLAGDLPPTAGSVRVTATARLTQRTELFRDGLRENLRLGAPMASDAQMMAVLAQAGLESIIHALPSGLDTELGDGGQGLSGGQARRLTLARLMLRDVPLWLLDEPTEGLDGETARDVLARLRHAAGNRATITATHIRREAEDADRLLILGDGGIKASHIRGSPGFEAALNDLRPD
ncbi:amino acid ABC transporter ATP-binding/permease protein [Pseudogemmobacter faecipullorum]|uniref:ATP-binding cassette domain-containing protein n=1 Tax=Pseudogemmobacter faecipullorum TaxID=2755041 RepID=A0ABS8CRV1_9RHOB|nr:ATP-binding cassette domain-containing protein [Pseudogemmobacter faecipullorum]MCB5412126.1 ATP-binding cassette domain-containing protein [Pseudogemmobacter faecipullorum]